MGRKADLEDVQLRRITWAESEDGKINYYRTGLFGGKTNVTAKYSKLLTSGSIMRDRGGRVSLTVVGHADLARS